LRIDVVELGSSNQSEPDRVYWRAKNSENEGRGLRVTPLLATLMMQLSYHGKLVSLIRLLQTKAGLRLHHDKGHNIDRVIASKKGLLSE
jgi:hypothetical protein